MNTYEVLRNVSDHELMQEVKSRFLVYSWYKPEVIKGAENLSPTHWDSLQDYIEESVCNSDEMKSTMEELVDNFRGEKMYECRECSVAICEDDDCDGDFNKCSNCEEITCQSCIGEDALENDRCNDCQEEEEEEEKNVYIVQGVDDNDEPVKSTIKEFEYNTNGQLEATKYYHELLKDTDINDSFCYVEMNSLVDSELVQLMNQNPRDCDHCGSDRGSHDVSDRNRLIPCESDGEGSVDGEAINVFVCVECHKLMRWNCRIDNDDSLPCINCQNYAEEKMKEENEKKMKERAEEAISFYLALRSIINSKQDGEW